MPRVICLILMCTAVVFGEFEVIPINGKLSGDTKDILWPVFSNGSISISENEVVIPDGTQLYVQSRFAPYENTQVNLKRHKKDSFTVYELSVSKEIYWYTVLAGDGRYYLFKKSRGTGMVFGPVPKHGLVDRMFIMPDNTLLATGAYRPKYVKYLDLYDDESQGVQTQLSKDMFMELYNNYKAFTLALYDNEISLIDSGNVINRTGENAQVFERLYINHVVDVTNEGIIFLIDNDDGYRIDEYERINKFSQSLKIDNKNFICIPKDLYENDLSKLRKRAGSYSVPYCLYNKGNYIITSFFQNPEWRGPVKGPYYYDIINLQGELVSSGTLDYPIITEDNCEKIFLFVKIEGGWFEDDEVFLVGVTIEDIIKGVISKGSIDESVARFKEG